MTTPPKNRRNSSWAVPVAVLGVMALLIGVTVVLNTSDEPPATDSADAPSRQDAPTEVQGPEQRDFSVAERRDEADLLAAGPVDAPVVLVAFSDYQCQYCAKWSDETLPLMLEQADAGNLRIEWRDVNVFGPASKLASRASYAAAEQGAFWEYHDALFAGGKPRPESGLTEDALMALAGDLDLDTTQFRMDLDSDSTIEQVSVNAQLGLDLGVYSTPVFTMGGQPLVGAQPSQVFVDAFEAALGAAE